MLGYKGFKSDLTCYGGNSEYEVGKTYTMDPHEIKIGEKGFHFFRYPLDVLEYYHDSDCLYARVTASGQVLDDPDKSVTNQITIDELLTRDQLFLEMPDYILRLNGDQFWYLDGQLH